MDIQTTIENGRAVLHLDGRFDFKCGISFRHATKPLLETPEINTLELDFDRVSFIDSSALGLLLLLRAQANDIKKEVVLTHSSAELRKVLSIAQFDKMFRIE